MQLTGIADRILVYVTLGYVVIATQFSQIAKKAICADGLCFRFNDPLSVENSIVGPPTKLNLVDDVRRE